MNNWIALLLTFIIALVWLRLVDFCASRGWIASSLSRKIIHIGTGPIFVLCWLLFNDLWYARWLAALVPFLITIQFLLVGTGLMKDEASVKAMSRTGNRSEILRGPLMYGIVFIILTLIFWRNSPIGISALMVLCAGDGLADLVGTRVVKSIRIPWSDRKSLIGSLAMFLGGWIATASLLFIFTIAGYLHLGVPAIILGSSIVSLAGTLVESLPFTDIDNLTVPLVVVCVAYLVF